MLRRVARSIRNFIQYHYRYPNATIHRTAQLSRNVSIDDRAQIKSGAHLTDSSLAEDVCVGSSSNILFSTLGARTAVHENCSLQKVKSESDVIFYNNGNFHDLIIGRYTYISTHATMSMVSVGRFCSIGPQFMCGLGDHPTDFASTSPIFFSLARQCGFSFAEQNLFEERKRIDIGHDVWIGARVFIRDGVRIGNGAIIAAGAVVVKDVPPYAIVGGVTAKLIRYRFPDEIIAELLKLQWWEWSEEKLRKAQPYFAQDDIPKLIAWASSETNL